MKHSLCKRFIWRHRCSKIPIVDSSVVSSAVFYSNFNAILVPVETANGQRVRSATVHATTPLFSCSLHLFWRVHHHPLHRADRSRSRSIAYRGLILYSYVTCYVNFSSFIRCHGYRLVSPRDRCRTSKIELLKSRNVLEEQYLPISQDDSDRRITPGRGRVRCSGDDRRGSPTWSALPIMYCS